MIIWFNTNSLPAYIKLFGLGNFLKVNNWKEYKISNSKISYIDFLLIKHPSFISELIQCKLCFLFWITLIIVILCGKITLLPVYYIISYILYKLLDKYVLKG